MHAGAVCHWKGQNSAAKPPHHLQESLTPLAGRKRLEAWGAALLQSLPQSFQDLAARWGLAPSEKQDSPSLQSASSSLASVSDVESHMSQQHQHDNGQGWPSESYSCSLPRLQLCPSSSAFHRPDAKQVTSRTLHGASGSLGVKRGRSAARDEQSDKKRRAITEGGAHSHRTVIATLISGLRCKSRVSQGLAICKLVRATAHPCQ